MSCCAVNEGDDCLDVELFETRAIPRNGVCGGFLLALRELEREDCRFPRDPAELASERFDAAFIVPEELFITPELDNVVILGKDFCFLDEFLVVQ